MHNRILILLAAFLVSVPALAWHDVGHKATARIAFGQLTSQRQAEIYAILKNHPRFDADFRSRMPAAIASGSATEQARWAFEQASVWPDIMRDVDDRTRTRFHRSRWHYINLPVWLTANDQTALDGHLDHNMARRYAPPMRQNLNAVQALRGNIEIWRDDDASDADKAVALCWILHLTGDLHQPLHTVALFSKPYFPQGDRGGNRIEVVWEPENRNLHAVWDGLPTHMPELEPAPTTIELIVSDVVDDAAIDRWVENHARIAEQFVYSEEVRAQLLARLPKQRSPLVELSSRYLASAKDIARQQVNLAGHRIAAVIE